MLRDKLRHLHDFFKELSPLERKAYAIMFIIVPFLIISLINFAPLYGWIKACAIIAAVVIAFGFLIVIYSSSRNQQDDSPEDTTEHDENQTTVSIPQMPSTPPTIGLPKVALPEDDDIKASDTDETIVSLSTFARQRIAKQLPTLKNSTVILEKRKTAWVLLLQLETRQPTGKTKNTWWSKRARTELEPSSTIIGVALSLLVSLIILGLAIAIVLSKSIDNGAFLGTSMLIIATLLVIRCLVSLYSKWAYWYYWRLLLFDANPSENVDAKAVIIDKPLLIPGGSVPSVDLRVVRLVSSSTARTQFDERSLRSIVAGWLRIEWLLVDTYGQGDVRFNWMGPFRHTPELVARIDQARRKARIEEQ